MLIVGRTSKREYSRCFPLNEHIVRVENMLFFGVFSILLAVTSAEFCYSNVEEACSTRPTASDKTPSCNAQYGAIKVLQSNLQAYIDANIDSSFELLLMSSYFGNYEAQREGLKKLYRKYSDQMWEDAISIIKYVVKRGGKMNFGTRSHFKEEESKVLELNEINSLAKALDIQKQLAREAMDIHSVSQPHNKHDGAIAHYIEERFLEPQAERVRELAGYTNDLKKLLKDRNSAVSIFLFDEYLQKSL